jgi:hypothetical protein
MMTEVWAGEELMSLIHCVPTALPGKFCSRQRISSKSVQKLLFSESDEYEPFADSDNQQTTTKKKNQGLEYRLIIDPVKI